MAKRAPFVGQPIRRTEDHPLLNGRATYVDDLRLPGMSYLAFVRSPHASARVRRVDAVAARSAPGVVAVITGADVQTLCSPLPANEAFPGMLVAQRWPLAVAAVSYVGEAVAAVVATSRAAAADAVDLVTVDYEPRPAVGDVEQALVPGTPVVHEHLATNQAFVVQVGAGDVAGAFARADRVIRLRLANPRLAPFSLESRGVLSSFDVATGQLTHWSSTQFPHQLRLLLSTQLGLLEQQVRVIAPEVGGGFGAKAELYPEEVLTAALAVKLGQPIKWCADRREEFATMLHGRGQVNELELAVTTDGQIRGLRHRILADLGAYCLLYTPYIPYHTVQMLTGPYDIPNAVVELIGVYTNRVPTGAYRGAGRAEASLVLERAIDVVAQELRLDRIDVRRRNFIATEAFPYSTASGMTYDSGDYARTLAMALDYAGYPDWLVQQESLRQTGRLIGIGVATCTALAAVGPSKLMGGTGWEVATLNVEKSGRVTVLTGASPHGQGTATAFKQIVADQLGVTMENVAVVHGDTARVPFGVGTYGSRNLAVGGSAIVLSCRKIREKASLIAAHLLEVNPSDVEFDDDRFAVRGVAERAVSFVEVARAAYMPNLLPPGMEPGLTATSFFEPANFTYPFSTHLCLVEIDRSTGQVTILRYVAVDDCGTMVNPLIVDGQIHGGVAQGIAAALREEIVYDAEGQLLTGSLLDYAAPAATDLPAIETQHTIT
ncbi:MAG TPA: xanthine dehydrogenase family protein molybdopterin-binding subunit, partial [Chloroflexota bacterium]